MLYSKIARFHAKTLFEKYGEESIDCGVPGKSKDDRTHSWGGF
jgi:hypothetical protein